jgi:hypothetical protein
MLKFSESVPTPSLIIQCKKYILKVKVCHNGALYVIFIVQSSKCV